MDSKPLMAPFFLLCIIEFFIAWQAPLNKALSKGGKEAQKERTQV
jgi:hypothetical protein